MTNSHLDQKDLKRPDAFQETASSVVEFVNENAKPILAGLALLFAVGLGYAFYSNHAVHRAEQAESALYEVKHQLAEQLAKLTPAPTKENPNPSLPNDWQSKAKDSIERVEKAAKDHSGTRAAFDAYMLLGDIHFVRKDAAHAIEYYQHALNNAVPRSAKPSAQYALAYAYEDLKQYDKASDLMRQVIGSGDSVLRPDALLALGRELTLKGDKTKALDTYNQVIKEFPNSQASHSAEAQITLLKVSE